MTNNLVYAIIITEREIKEETKMMSYKEMDPMVAAEMFGASLEEILVIAGVTLEEFYEDNKEDTEG